MQTDFESMNVGMFWGDMESILFLKKKKVYVCECVFLLFLLNETIKKNLKKRKKEDLRNIKWMGVIFFIFMRWIYRIYSF